MSVTLPSVPFPGFPLRPHQNGQWYKSVWNSRTKRSEHFYFGPWRDDRSGERALNDPQSGWLARRSGIKSGTDNVRISITPSVLTLGELMSRFLIFKRGLVISGDLSARTLGDYIRETRRFCCLSQARNPNLSPQARAFHRVYALHGRRPKTRSPCAPEGSRVYLRFAFAMAQEMAGFSYRAPDRNGLPQRRIPIQCGGRSFELERRTSPIGS